MLKNSILLLIVSLVLVSCYAYKAPAIEIGMSVDDFKNVAKYEQIVAMDQEWTVYKVTYGYNFERTGYYYFKKGKLIKMDSEEYRPDYVVEVDKN